MSRFPFGDVAGMVTQNGAGAGRRVTVASPPAFCGLGSASSRAKRKAARRCGLNASARLLPEQRWNGVLVNAEQLRNARGCSRPERSRGVAPVTVRGG
jgi:hypothetical protein